MDNGEGDNSKLKNIVGRSVLASLLLYVTSCEQHLLCVYIYLQLDPGGDDQL